MLGCRVYVYDNTPEHSSTRQCINKLEHAVYYTAGKNMGLGVGLSTVCAQAYYESFPTLLFFDQDTIFNQETISFIQDFSQTNLEQIQSKYSMVVFGGRSYRVEDQNTLAKCRK